VPTGWGVAYADLVGRLPGLVGNARLTLCGLNVCIDAVAELHDAAALLEQRANPHAFALAGELKRRVAKGIGGEIRVDWPEGPAWLEQRLRLTTALGGTSAHAALVLATLGAPALLALADRSKEQLGHIHPAVLLAENDHPIRVDDIVRRGASRPKIFIFEYTAGRAVGAVVPTRSSRIIVRFGDPGVEDDPEFERVSARLARMAGAGVVSGFNAAALSQLPRAIEVGRRIASSWRAADMPTVHLELAGYVSDAARDSVLEGLRGAITSLGMSHSEYLALGLDAADLTAGMVACGNRFGLRRVCVHADHWAAAATLDHPAHERDALQMGCLLASTRAEAGRPVHPTAIPKAAVFNDTPFEGTLDRGAWTAVCCAAPYLARPATTLGLGDTFTAGCLLVLGQQRPDEVRSRGVRAEGSRRRPATASGERHG
jgi:ADP-dependent phosphofructokinase/glucokinase